MSQNGISRRGSDDVLTVWLTRRVVAPVLAH
jgi:hypothetical protein